VELVKLTLAAVTVKQWTFTVSISKKTLQRYVQYLV